MILQKDSVFYNLPIQLGNRNLLLLDTLRFSLEMIDYNWIQLSNSLKCHSGNRNIKEITVLFNYAWMIIDNIDRFTKICKKLPSESNHHNLDSFNSVTDFRNTFAHLHQRIDEIFLKTHTPFFGTLSWIYKDIEMETLVPFIAISGINYGVQSKFKLPDYSEELPTISNVLLESAFSKEKKSIFIDKLILELKSLVNETEKHIENYVTKNNFERLDWSSQRDILLIIESEK